MIVLKTYDKRVPVTTAWRVLGLRMEKQTLDMKGSCEYIELRDAYSRQKVPSSLSAWWGADHSSP
jgi:hypothetical protein